MPLFDHITLHKMIVHKVDHRKHKEPILADAESPVDNEEVKFFIRRHIDNGEQNRYARSGVFAEAEEGATCFRQICDDLLGDEEKFIDSSQQIAAHLFETVKDNKNISPGDLIVVTYTNGNPQASKRLAILKMDPEDGFVGKQEILEGGTIRIVLERVSDVLPIKDLQKCAFVMPEDNRTLTKHLVFLDQQNARRGETQMAASFFTKDFLQCQVGLNRLEQTNAFIYTAFDYKTEKEKEGVWEDGQGEVFIDAAQAALAANQIDVEKFAQTVIENEDEQQEFLQRVKTQMDTEDYGNLIFQPDSNFQTQQQHMVIEGDNNLKISILADAVGTDKTLSIETTADNRRRITITTTKFVEKVTLGKRK